MARTRDVWAACLCGGMGLAVVAGLAWGHHERRIHQLQDRVNTVSGGLRTDLDALTKLVGSGGPVPSRVDPDDASDEAEVLREWSRRDRRDNPWPDAVTTRRTFDRRPPEGGTR